ncbi:hypothetical protein HPB48_001803 [Haemaphysalis longicornis]|uniref:Uncharacterized protein n=1 Tax=Haemaphysalis longicornis TaxID=44386 RepID=A0A9J6FUS6_HAELO|nr:hypothetical protein HPB48_001803 [Haemaphysalis longicornis]
MTQDEDETNDDIREPASKRRCLGLFQDWCDEEDGKAARDELEEYLHGKEDYSCSDPMHAYMGIAGLSLMGAEKVAPLQPALNVSQRAADHLKAIHRSWRSLEQKSDHCSGDAGDR